MNDDLIKVRHVNHYQLSYVAGEPGEVGTFTLQLVLDEGAWEEVLTLAPDDADPLQEMLARSQTVFYDIERRTLMFGTSKVGSAI